MYDVIETPKTLSVVLEMVTGGDLFDRIVAQDGKGFSEEVARYMFEQMLAAIKYLHGRSIVHRGRRHHTGWERRAGDSAAAKLRSMRSSAMLGHARRLLQRDSAESVAHRLFALSPCAALCLCHATVSPDLKPEVRCSCNRCCMQQ
jgi:hypothetical protein